MNIAGFCLVNWINYGLSFVEGSVAWRFPLAFQFVFIFVLFATVPWLPESPRYVTQLTKGYLLIVVKVGSSHMVVLQKPRRFLPVLKINPQLLQL